VTVQTKKRDGTAGREYLMTEFEALRALATRVINEHVDDCGLCAVCGSAFPCELAVLAEHNLGLLRDPRSPPSTSTESGPCGR